ncbi:MAG: hypothetical protein AAGG02_20855, partial [Cyanobacteria bacterium P01_H01_bin.15]
TIFDDFAGMAARTFEFCHGSFWNDLKVRCSCMVKQVVSMQQQISKTLLCFTVDFDTPLDFVSRNLFLLNQRLSN